MSSTRTAMPGATSSPVGGEAEEELADGGIDPLAVVRWFPVGLVDLTGELVEEVLHRSVLVLDAQGAIRPKPTGELRVDATDDAVDQFSCPLGQLCESSGQRWR